MFVVSAVIFVACSISICLTLPAITNRYRSFIQIHRNGFSLIFLAPVSLFVADRLRLTERFSGTMTKIHQKMLVLYSNKSMIYGYTKMFIAQTISAILLFLLLFSFASMVDDGNPAYLLLGILFAGITPAYMLRELDKKIKRKRQRIIIELPEFLNKVTLLVNAGETVQQAIIRCIDHKREELQHPLYFELSKLKQDLSTNRSFQQAIDEFSKRCGVQEVSFFSTTVLMNYRRGGDEFVLALRELSNQLWEKRKAMTRTLGEEASAKLVFPMMIIFIVIMVVIAAPAVMLMNE